MKLYVSALVGEDFLIEQKHKLCIGSKNKSEIETVHEEKRERKREREREREREIVFIEKLNFLLNDRLKLTEIFIVPVEHN